MRIIFVSFGANIYVIDGGGTKSISMLGQTYCYKINPLSENKDSLYEQWWIVNAADATPIMMEAPSDNNSFPNVMETRNNEVNSCNFYVQAHNNTYERE